MAASKEELKERYRQSRENFSKKILKTFLNATPKIGHASEEEGLSKEERQECICSLNKLHHFNSGRRVPGWPFVKIEEFLNAESSLYKEQADIFRSLRIETLGRFFKVPFFVIRVTFMERGVRLPTIFEILHLEFNRREVVPSPEKRTLFSFQSTVRELMQSSDTL